MNFQDLAKKEEHVLQNIPEGTALPSVPRTDEGHSGEPQVVERREARIGLALSGGGVRSATFALGMLQALQGKRMLRHFHYLSTVSGGGYAGAFWTRWRKEAGAAPVQEIFDTAKPGDCAEVRHLREFSRFLVPRMGIFSMDVWWPLAVFVGGLFFTLLIGLSFLVFLLTGWVWLAANDCFFAVLGGFTLAAVLLLEYRNYRYHQVQKSALSQRGTVMGTLAAMAGFWVFWRMTGWGGSVELLEPLCTAGENKVILFGPALAWLAGAVVAAFVRLVPLRFKSGGAFGGALERVIGRLLSFAFFWSCLAGVWAAALHFGRPESSTAGTGVWGTTAAGMTALFAFLHRKLEKAANQKNSAAWKENIAMWMLQLVAWAALVLIMIAVALALLGAVRSGGSFLAQLGVSVAILVVIAVFYEPNRTGLHSFYRSRIARCFLGAARASVPAPRFSAEMGEDDMPLAEDKRLPIHLVCCAANHQAGDQLPTLHRGAQSAVLSRHGLHIGDDCTEHPGLRLSSAVTASAAAFNTQMGSLSAELGMPVAFLAGLLNLRLGLWLPHPRASNTLPGRYKVFPGLLYFYEILNLTRTNGAAVHLSDGGHFENLAAYELIRRRCSTIVIVDASADPGRNFENLGNLVRRVREDFGVELDLDITPLKPGEDGLCKATAVAGQIVYHPDRPAENGLVIYIKPGLTGEEPEDIRQYRCIRKQFPHESTGDQFFDEAQWEAYRRLGQHIGEMTFDSADAEEPSAHVVFDAVRRSLALPTWQAESRWQQLNELCRKLESDMSTAAGGQLLREAWPETVAAPPATPPADAEILSALVRMMTIIEEVYLSTRPPRQAGDHIDEAWANWMNRWISIPSLRRWWWVLAPMYGPGLRDYLKERGLAADPPV